MSYRVIISDRAEQDLRSIYSYIAFDLLSPQNAAGQLDRLQRSILGLGTLPERFRLYDKEPWRSFGLRVMPVDNYIVLYLTDPSQNSVNILRIMYQGRNIEDQLEKS